jgi:mono/diheme cytochrome c family protein
MTRLAVLLHLAVSAIPSPDVTEPDIDGYTKDVAPFFKQHCAKCHTDDKAKAKLDLGKLNYDLTSDNKDLEKWQSVLDRVQRGEMPPEGQKQPDAEAVAKAMGWLKAELRKTDPKLVAKSAHKKRELPRDGNSVPHESLFGVAAKPGGASPARVWRLSPQAYTELTKAIIGKNQKSPPSQPFSTLTEDGLKDYAAAFTIDAAIRRSSTSP